MAFSLYERVSLRMILKSAQMIFCTKKIRQCYYNLLQAVGCTLTLNLVSLSLSRTQLFACASIVPTNQPGAALLLHLLPLDISSPNRPVALMLFSLIIAVIITFLVPVLVPSLI